MANRKEKFENGELYHIYNRGTDKRIIFADKQDFFQFLQMLELFNITVSLGGLRESRYPANIEVYADGEILVEIIAYCLNPNHFHLILKQVSDEGISKFMQKVGTGFTMYFNNKYKRSGSLFSGAFKSKHIDTDEYLRLIGVYVQLNNKIHNIDRHPGLTSVPAYVSSWNEYIGKSKLNLCKNKEVLLADFQNITAYQRFALDTLGVLKKNKEMQRELDNT